MPHRPAGSQRTAMAQALTSGRGQNHVGKLRSCGDLGHPTTVALQGPSQGHLLGHFGKPVPRLSGSMALD